jgi:hypothetical protein
MTDNFTHPVYADYPDLDKLPSYCAEMGKKRHITNLMLLFLDFQISDSEFNRLKDGNFERTNIIEMVNDLKHYGYDVKLPETAGEYRDKVYPALMDLINKLGYYGLQIPTGTAEFDDDGILTDAAIKQLELQKQVTEEAGLVVSAMGIAWDLDWKCCLKPQIQAAKVFGSKYLFGPYASTFLYFPEGHAYGPAAADWVQERIKSFSETLQTVIGPWAKEHGVIICEEALQRYERMPLRLKEVIQLVNMANIDEFIVMIDMCHEMADGEGPEIYKSYVEKLVKKNQLGGVHVSAVHRAKVYESWFTPDYFEGFFKPLFDNGFEGEIAIETFDGCEPVMEPAFLNRHKFKSPISVLINQLTFVTTMLGNVSK